MYNCLNYIKNLLVFLTLLITKASFSQELTTKDLLPDFSQNKITDTVATGKSAGGLFKLELATSVVNPGKFKQITGKYALQSNIQSSYSLGFIYSKLLDKGISFDIGAGIEIGKRNFHVDIPAIDNNGFDGEKIIEDKSLWTAIRLPLTLEKRIKKKSGIKAGFVIRYSGFTLEEEFTVTSVRANNQSFQIFKSEIDGSNNGKLWAALLVGFSKFYNLKNNNVLSVNLRTEVSLRNFTKGKYEITIPNQPVSSGLYQVNGSLIGLFFQYHFTGTNKRLLKEYQKER